MKSPPPSRIRCVIYTRVSTDQGLDQDFNSLDVRIPTKPAMHSNLKPAGYSDLKPATLGVLRMGLRDDVLRFGGGQAAG